ncbi:hypothetical protein IWZ01DRAFT_100585 [Phyllosticta capitalensis]
MFRVLVIAVTPHGGVSGWVGTRRCVTAKEWKASILLMPGSIRVPCRIGVRKSSSPLYGVPGEFQHFNANTGEQL